MQRHAPLNRSRADAAMAVSATGVSVMRADAMTATTATTATTVGAMATVHPRARVATTPTLARRASHRATPTTNVPRPCACSSSAYMPGKTMVGASTIDPPVALTDVMTDVMSAGPMAQATTAATSEAMIAVGGRHRVDRAGRERPPERRFDSRPPERSRDARDHTSAPMRSQYAPPAQPIAQAHHQGPKTDAEKAGGVRLNKRLAELGLCSRREGDQWIDNGWVLVNGEVGEMGQTVSEEDRIDVSPDAHAEQAQQVTILLHKPMGYVSGLPEDGHESAATLIGPQSQWTEDPTRTRFQARFTRGLAPAGRLDIDSTGLIVFTQNGIIARTLIGENSNIEKEYLVRVIWIGDGADAPVEKDVQAEFPEERLALLREGLLLDNQVLKPAKVSWQNTEQLRFVLREGKKRQIRRMCEQVGLKVVGLKRVRIGSINLAQLPVGQWRYLGPTERF